MNQSVARSTSCIALLFLVALQYSVARCTELDNVVNRDASESANVLKISLGAALQPAHNAFDISSRPWSYNLSRQDTLVDAAAGTEIRVSIADRMTQHQHLEISHEIENLPDGTTLVALHPSYSSPDKIRQSSSTALAGGLVSVGGYYTNISIGGKSLPVLVDTGSSTLAVLASDINQQSNGIPFFNSSSFSMISCSSSKCQSNTCSSALCSTSSCSSQNACCLSMNGKNGCFFNLQYGDGSGASGALFEQVAVSINDLSAKVSMGAIVNDTKGFQVGSALGIIGLAFSRLACNPTCITPFFDELVTQQNISNIFTIFLKISGGTLTLGGIDSSLFKGSLSYVPMENRQRKRYLLHSVNGLSVDGNVLNNTTSMTAAVDSGTTTLVFDETIYDTVRSYFQSHYCSVPGLCPASGSNTTWFSSNFCVVLDDNQLSDLPTISLQLKNDVVLHLGSTDYMVQVQQSLSTGPFALASTASTHATTDVTNGKSVRCLAINKLQGLKAISGMDMILGDTVLRKYYTTFDFSRRQWATKFADPFNEVEDSKYPPLRLSLNKHAGSRNRPNCTGNLVSKEFLVNHRQFQSNKTKKDSLNLHVRLPEQKILGGVVSVGMYYIELEVGCGQTIHVQIDTGSSTTAIPLKECVDCKSNDRRYDFSQCPNNTRGEMISCESEICGANTCGLSYCGSCSISSRACCSQVDHSKCGFILRYGDGAFAQGTVIHESITVANISLKTYFGGILKDSPSFELTEVDGVFGMAFPILACNPTCLTPVFDDMVAQGLIEKDIFSIHSDLENGILVLGGGDDRLYDGELQYSPLMNQDDPEFYEVECESVSVSGAPVDLPYFRTAVVDSGTTLIIVSLDSFLALKRYFQAHYCNVSGLCGAEGDQSLSWFDPDYCALLEEDEVRQLPTIEFHLRNNVTLSIEPEDYMLRVESPNLLTGEVEVYRCIGIHYMQHLERMGNDIILGGTILQRYYTVYDRENMRLGFAKAKRWSEVAHLLDETQMLYRRRRQARLRYYQLDEGEVALTSGDRSQRESSQATGDESINLVPGTS
eukprot:jgi/Galph1/4863/GphlegSOOS_G3581.1